MYEFDEKIGLEYLKTIHVNDSKNIRGSHKDRHENIGFGYIGFDTLIKFIYDEKDFIVIDVVGYNIEHECSVWKY